MLYFVDDKSRKLDALSSFTNNYYCCLSLVNLLTSRENDEPQLHLVSAIGLTTWNELLIKVSLYSIEAPLMYGNMC